MPLNQLVLTELYDADLLKSLDGLQHKGWIEQTAHYCYLKIDNRFVDYTFPLLTRYGDLILKPDYFNTPNAIGAHISLIYPEEQANLMNENIGQIHSFEVSKLIKAQFETSTYFILAVIAPSLSRLRQMHHLSLQPTFKGYHIMLHITIGVLSELH
jgi:hypothetical protein